MSQPNAVAVTEGLSADAFHQLLELAIEGRGRLTGARHAAKKLLVEHGDPEKAISKLVLHHVALAGGQGFVTNWGGVIVSLVTIPVNLASASFLQARVVSGIAHLRGYELADPRVRTAILMVMLGPNAAASLVSRGVLPSSPMAVATAPAFDANLDGQISGALLEQAMNQISGKRLGVFVGKRIPLVGGGVGAVVDGWHTRQIAMHAMAEFPSRRPRTGFFVAITADDDSPA